MPRGPSSGRTLTPASAAGPPVLKGVGWGVWGGSHSAPGGECTRGEIPLHILPHGQKTAPSLPWAVERSNVDAGECGGAARLEVDRMGGMVGQHLVAGAAVHPERDLVAHRARRQEDGHLLAEEVRDHLGQQVDRRVFAFLLVTD